VTYAWEFDVDFSMTLRERISPTMLIIQEDAIDIEGNMIASGNMKKKQDQAEKKSLGKTVVLLIQIENPKKQRWMRCLD
jgi:hypothetical protein